MRNGRPIISGTFSAEGDRLTWLTDDSCASPDGAALTYTWTLEEDILTFQLVYSPTRHLFLKRSNQ